MILLYEDIQKTADESHIALSKLRSFLDTKEPELVKFLVNLWNNQGKAITYKELREAILKGYLTAEFVNEWHKDYSKYVVDYVQPLFIEAMEAANEPIIRENLLWHFDSDSPSVKLWNEQNAARFVTSVNNDQIKAIRHVVQRASQLHEFNVDSLARVIRPMVGLNYQQARANMNYYETLIENGVSEKKAIERSIRYSARQSRYRAQMIARTELAFTFNQGTYEGTRQAQMAGILGDTIKKWCTADDERVCSCCGGLEGAEVEMDADFYFDDVTRINPKLHHQTIGKVPPAHPHCRCTVLYIEKEPPTKEDLERAKDSPYIIRINM